MLVTILPGIVPAEMFSEQAELVPAAKTGDFMGPDDSMGHPHSRPAIQSAYPAHSLRFLPPNQPVEVHFVKSTLHSSRPGQNSSVENRFAPVEAGNANSRTVWRMSNNS